MGRLGGGGRFIFLLRRRRRRRRCGCCVASVVDDGDGDGGGDGGGVAAAREGDGGGGLLFGGGGSGHMVAVVEVGGDSRWRNGLVWTAATLSWFWEERRGAFCNFTLSPLVDSVVNWGSTSFPESRCSGMAVVAQQISCLVVL